MPLPFEFCPSMRSSLHLIFYRNVEHTTMGLQQGGPSILLLAYLLYISSSYIYFSRVTLFQICLFSCFRSSSFVIIIIFIQKALLDYETSWRKGRQWIIESKCMASSCGCSVICSYSYWSW